MQVRTTECGSLAGQQRMLTGSREGKVRICNLEKDERQEKRAKLAIICIVPAKASTDIYLDGEVKARSCIKPSSALRSLPPDYEQP